MKILYVQANGIGNTIMSTPSMQAIRWKYPNVQYDLMIDQTGFPVIEDWHIFDNIYTDETQLEHIHYDIVILSEPRNDGRFMILAQNARKIVRHPDSHYRTHAIRPQLKHEVVVNMEIAESLGYRGEYPPLYVKRASESDDFRIFHNKICVHVGATNNFLAEKKKWILSRWVKVINALGPENVFIIGSHSEKEDADYICQKTGAHNACGNYSLSETARVIVNSSLLLSTDSGPMHIAAAVGTSVVTLFGGTSAEKNRPWAPVPRFAVIQSDIICAPCQFTPRYKSCRNYECMKRITIKKVLEAIDKIQMLPTQIHSKDYCYKSDFSDQNNLLKYWNVFYDIVSFIKWKALYKTYYSRRAVN